MGLRFLSALVYQPPISHELFVSLHQSRDDPAPVSTLGSSTSFCHCRCDLLSSQLHCAIVPVYTRNITVDDQGIDPTTGTYITYEAEWAVGPDCSSCGSQPDPTFAYDGTWHDTSYSIINPHDFVRNATFRFTGTAIYVYGMVNSAFGIDLVFFLDGQDAGRFSMPPTGEFNYSYNQLYFQAEGLNHTTHTWILQNGRGENVTSNVLLDYLVYMKDDAAGNSSLPLFGESVPSSGTAAQSTSSDSSTNTSTSLRATVTVETRANGLPPSGPSPPLLRAGSQHSPHQSRLSTRSRHPGSHIRTRILWRHPRQKVSGRPSCSL
ncbi:hypothetical protein PsYK624_053990 [Phanerochaete sordida]|uniref:Uncharacterized protein n=1 Tax=Phanerochaete sordida TaxID=48140 RepID=A0A9P3G513_9APHY|nr:hypothetical protein PsYK624_053990 [Phanerochaete sordida]